MYNWCHLIRELIEFNIRREIHAYLRVPMYYVRVNVLIAREQQA